MRLFIFIRWKKSYRLITTDGASCFLMYGTHSLESEFVSLSISASSRLLSDKFFCCSFASHSFFSFLLASSDAVILALVDPEICVVNDVVVGAPDRWFIPTDNETIHKAITVNFVFDIIDLRASNTGSCSSACCKNQRSTIYAVDTQKSIRKQKKQITFRESPILPILFWWFDPN